MYLEILTVEESDKRNYLYNYIKNALKKGASRKAAIMAAYNRFYKGDIAKEFVRGAQEQGGLITMEDLANWKPIEEEPTHTNYKGIDVYKLQAWTQGPSLLQAFIFRTVVLANQYSATKMSP